MGLFDGDGRAWVSRAADWRLSAAAGVDGHPGMAVLEVRGELEEEPTDQGEEEGDDEHDEYSADASQKIFHGLEVHLSGQQEEDGDDCEGGGPYRVGHEPQVPVLSLKAVHSAGQCVEFSIHLLRG